jgi:uncharacterized protein YebE (UPF0316 family)
MEFLATLDIYSTACIIYFLRIIDVSIDTIRTISIIAGRRKLSFVLGFFEVFIWIMAVSQVIIRVKESYIIAVAYALGFATGNVVGICLERIFSVGYSVVRLFSDSHGSEIANLLKSKQYHPFVVKARGDKGEIDLIYSLVHSGNIGRIIKTARTIDASLTYIIEPVKSSNMFRMRKTLQI